MNIGMQLPNIGEVCCFHLQGKVIKMNQLDATMIY